MSIRARVLICLTLLVAGGFYYLADWVVDDLRPRYLEAMEESLVDTATILSVMVAESLAGEDVPTEHLRDVFDEVSRRQISARIYSLLKTEVTLRVYVTDAMGIVVFDSDGGRDEGRDYSAWNDVHLTLQGQYGARATRTDPSEPSTSSLYVAAPLIVNGEISGVVTVVKPVVTSSLFIQSARRKVVIAALLAALAVALLGVITSAWVTRPIRMLTNYAQAVRDGKRVTLPKLGHNEIGVMGAALAEMHTALEGKEYVEQYVQTLTHEVKGPLSAIRGAAELMDEEMPEAQREKFLKNVKTETARIQQIVDRLLFLSSLQSRNELREIEDLDLVPLIREIAESSSPTLTAKTVSLETEWPESLTVRGERFLVRHAIANLLQNAVDFSPPGGRIVLTLTGEGQAVNVCIADDGPGIPDYATQRVFDPFYSLQRPDTGEKSSGLGLTFVRSVAELHGGRVSVENGPRGGVVATLTLRTAPPA